MRKFARVSSLCGGRTGLQLSTLQAALRCGRSHTTVARLPAHQLFAFALPSAWNVLALCRDCACGFGFRVLSRAPSLHVVAISDDSSLTRYCRTCAADHRLCCHLMVGYFVACVLCRMPHESICGASLVRIPGCEPIVAGGLACTHACGDGLG